MSAMKKQNVSSVKEHDEENENEEPKAKVPRYVDSKCVLDTKRVRTVPPAESKLQQWIFDNIEAKPGYKIMLGSLYDQYTQHCQNTSCNAVDIHIFRKRILDEHGAEFGLKEGSPCKGAVKEVKKKPPKAKSDMPKVTRSLIIEAIEHFGNPTKGVQYRRLYQYLLENYPALQLGSRTNILKTALVMQTRFDHVILVRGIGKCGYYRLPGGPDDEDDNKDEKDDEKTAKENKTDDEESADDKGEGATDEKVEGEEAEPKKKQKPKKASSTKHISKKHMCNPQRIDDAIPLALAYMSEPKEASLIKIKTYLAKYFNKGNHDDKIKQALKNGLEYGLYEKVQASYQLQVDDLNPTHTQTTQDMINLAILASNTPKQASGRLIKEYMIAYHPQFKVAERPGTFKRALERCVNGGLIRQVTGIGAAGSFELVDQFVPSPRILAGKVRDDAESSDDSDDSGKASSVDDIDSDYDSTKEMGYKPRPTRSRRGGPLKDKPVPVPRKAPTDRSRAKSQPKTQVVKQVEKSADEGSEDEMEEEPPVKVARKSNVSTKNVATDSEGEDDAEKKSNVATPTKKGNVGRTAKKGDAASPSKKGEAASPSKKGEAASPSKRGEAASPGKKGEAASPGKKGDAASPSKKQNVAVAKKRKTASPTKRSNVASKPQEDSAEEDEEKSDSKVEERRSVLGKRSNVKSYVELESDEENDEDHDGGDEDEEVRASSKNPRGSPKKVVKTQKGGRRHASRR